MEKINVGMFEYKKAQSPDSLYSGLVGACIVVGAICGEEGYMAHYIPGITIYIDELLKDLKEEIDNLSSLDIYVAGARFNFDDDPENVDAKLKGREECVDKIINAGFAKNIRKVDWGKQNLSQRLTLDLSERKAIFEEVPF